MALSTDFTDISTRTLGEDSTETPRYQCPEETFWPDHEVSPDDCYCPTNYLQAKNYCMHQNWIIGFAAGGAGFVILVMLVVIIVLCYQGKKGAPDTEKAETKDDDQSSSSSMGNKLPEDDTADSISEASSGDGSQKKSASVHMAEDQEEYQDIQHYSGDSNPMKDTSPTGQTDTTAARDATAPAAANGNVQMRDHRDERETYYNEAYHRDTQQQPTTDSMLYDDHNVVPILDTRGSPPDDRYQDTVVPARKEDSKDTMESLLDSEMCKNFQANLDHIDPRVDYGIKRPMIMMNGKAVRTTVPTNVKTTYESPDYENQWYKMDERRGMPKQDRSSGQYATSLA